MPFTFTFLFGNFLELSALSRDQQQAVLMSLGTLARWCQLLASYFNANPLVSEREEEEEVFLLLFQKLSLLLSDMLNANVAYLVFLITSLFDKLRPDSSETETDLTNPTDFISSSQKLVTIVSRYGTVIRIMEGRNLTLCVCS